MAHSITTISVDHWVAGQIEKHRKKKPGQKFLTTGSGLYSANKNIDIFVDEDVELLNSLGEKLIVQAGWRLVVFRAYNRYANGNTVATIFGPEEQITIKWGAKFNIKQLSLPKPRPR